MTCAVCGRDLGIWAKLSGHSAAGICKECHEQGTHRLERLAKSVGSEQVWNQQFARGWLSQCEDIARTFHISNDEACRLRSALMDNIFRLIEAPNEIAQADFSFVAELVREYSIKANSPEGIKDAIFRIGTREAIQNWEHGEPPAANCAGLVLQKNEKCHWEEGAGLRIQTIKRHYEGGYASISFPVVKGVRLRTGGFRGYPIDETVVESGGTGVLHLTNQRVCFVGTEHSVAIPYKKMISIQGFETGFTIRTVNEKRPGIFVVRHPELTVQLVNLASGGPNEDEPLKKRNPKARAGS